MPRPAISWQLGSRILSGKALRYIGGWLCGVAMLGWVASQSGPRTGTVVVHVTEPNVAVSVDGQRFHVGDQIHIPLICDLAAGEHRLAMTRGAEVLYAAHFSIVGGEDLVLTTWRVSDPAVGGPSRAKSSLGRSDAVAEEVSPRRQADQAGDDQDD